MTGRVSKVHGAVLDYAKDGELVITLFTDTIMESVSKVDSSKLLSKRQKKRLKEIEEGLRHSRKKPFQTSVAI